MALPTRKDNKMYDGLQNWKLISSEKPKRDIFHVIEELLESKTANRVVWLFVGACVYTAGVLAIL
jgi:hypothetical protein